MPNDAVSFDYRQDPEVRALLGDFPPLQHLPLVGKADLAEARKVFRVLPALDYPIVSAGQLLDLLGGADARLEIEGVSVDPARMIKYVPASFFPIVGPENLLEKMAELIRAHRKQVKVYEELTRIKRQLPGLRFPVGSADELLGQIGSRQSIRFQGGAVLPRKVMERVPDSIFPIESEEDFDRKIGHLMLTRPLITGD